MRKLPGKTKSSGIKKAFVFLFLVGLIVSFSLILKLGDTLSKSVYDGHSRFTIEVIRNKNPQIVSLYPSRKEIAIYNYQGSENSLVSLSVPFDSKISSDIVFTKENFSGEFSDLLFNTKNNLIFFDKFRLLYFVKTASSDSIRESAITDSSDISSFLKDDMIAQDGKTIQIVNATGESGVANSLAAVIANMGGNVVLLTTDQKESESTKIVYAEESYTLNRLSSYFNLQKVKATEKSIADIVIIVGKNSLKSGKF